MITWLITGCSTGLGRALASAVLARGDSAVVTARDPGTVAELCAPYPDRALTLPLDVTSPEQVRDAVAVGTERFGGIDVLVNNAGYGYRAAVEEGDPADVERLFATHVHGPVDLVKAVLPGMRARRAGTLVTISSIAARSSPAGSGYYAAAKAAMEALTSSLRVELAPLGIVAFSVEPGAFRTEFSGRSLTQSAVAIADYAETAGKRRKEYDTMDGTQPGDPARAAEAIIAAVTSPEPPALLVLGTDARRRLTEVLAGQQADLVAWAEVGVGTDFDAT
ncbi:oxidoreductase [Pseudonocardia sp. NPDC049154]|uniref:oxidoreductase n=1 Tax=Pseudonocardia sp. NPDC049154 TaxID=3155501 RepID=UPI0033D0A393